MGYDATRPKGSFQVFPKTPIADDADFIGMLHQERILSGARPGPGTIWTICGCP
jgi:aspartate aminotransferase